MKINEEKNCKINTDDSLKSWSKYAKIYDPIKCASIDGIDAEPHDRAVIRALNSTYKPNRFVKGCPECTIFVSRLNHETSKDTIKEIFSKYGKIKRFRMVKDIVTGMPKGYAFVEYEEEQAAEEAYRIANKMVVDGNTIFVDFECERLLKGWRPRRLGGGFAGKKESGQLRFGGRDRPFKKPIALELKEKEAKKQREERKRREDEQRHRDDRSRERHKRQLPVDNAPPKDRTKRGSPQRPKARHSSTARDKSPPQKVARHNSPLRDTSRRQSPLKENFRHQSPLRDNAKQWSPQRDHIKTQSSSNMRLNSPSRTNVKHHITSRKNALHHSSNHESTRLHSPPIDKGRTGRHSPMEKNADWHSRENLRQGSSPREKVKSSVNHQEKHYSPREQNVDHYSPLQKHFRSNERRRSPPMHRGDQSLPPARRPDSFPSKEDRYRSPINTSPRRSERQFLPTRENNRPYDLRYHSPVRDNVRRAISPQTETYRGTSPVHEPTRHYSPPKEYQQRFSAREIRHRSPSSGNSRNFPGQHDNANYSQTYYPGPQGARKYSPVREPARPFSPPSRDARQPPPFRGDNNFSPPRENARYFPPARDNERHSQTTNNVGQYSSNAGPGNYDYYSQESTIATFPSPHGPTQWHSNHQNRGRRFPGPRGKFRGSFRQY